jgi:transcriptional regulator with XRE-family HTH domain
MNTIVRVKGGYSFSKGLERAKTRLAYYEEGLFIETAARIIEAMENQDVTRSELARRLNVSPAYITKILRGHANLSLESLAKLAFALGLKWECVLIPKAARLGAFLLTNETGVATVCTVETATTQGVAKAPCQDEYESDVQTEETRREMRIPA